MSSSSPSPENLSPAVSPATSQPLSPLTPRSSPLPLQIIPPFPSPLQPSPPDPAATPPSLPPAISPASSDPLPPAVDPPQPATSLPPPLSSSPPAPVTASAPPSPELPSSPPSPLVVVTSSPPPSEITTPSSTAPESLPPPPPSKITTPLPPAPESPPPPPPEPSLPPQAPENLTPPLPSTPSVPSITPSPPQVAEIIPSPLFNSSPVTSPPTMDSPPQTPPSPSASSTSPPLPSSFSPPLPSSQANGSLPAAVQIQRPRQNANFSLGFIVGFAFVAFVVVSVIFLVVACVCHKRRRRRSYPGLSKATSLGSKDSFTATTLQRHSPLGQPAPIKSNAATITSSIDSEPNIPNLPQSDLTNTHGIFTYDQLVVATNGFLESNLIGEGGFGYVYKGVLPSGKEVAVKQLRTRSRQGEREFQAEVDIISRVHHKHLVSLVGYCITGAERLLVYDFVPNNTLEFHLHGKQQEAMEWATRLKIAIGSAKGLAYLHEDCNPKIIHRDIKASNILLDFKFEAKVSDFGLAKSFSDTSTQMTHISTRVVGTFGYLAPEYASSGKVTEKSDLYSYGVMLLELITGRPPITSIDPMRNQSLVEWARPLLAQALEDGYFETLVDPRLQRNYDVVEMSRMVACAAACVRHSAWLRPRMIQIVHALEGHAPLMDLREGIMPGSSTLYSSPCSSYNAHQYKNDLNKFHITIADQEYGSTMYSGSTSEYGLNPSVSSSEAHQTLRN